MNLPKHKREGSDQTGVWAVAPPAMSESQTTALISPTSNLSMPLSQRNNAQKILQSLSRESSSQPGLPSASSVSVPYGEVLAAWQVLRPTVLGCFCAPKDYAFVVYAVARKPRSPSTWKLEEHIFSTNNADLAKDWVARINAAVQLCHDRPKNLLVFVNPYSGARKAAHVWERDVLPIFIKARIKFTVILTEKADHACDMVGLMKAEELSQYQGIVAIGGDGVFQEIMMGLLQQRTRGPYNAAVASRIRIGHIPGGSTDAVAYTLHGTRSAETAALHITVGDRLGLDVGHVQSEDGKHKHFVCQAAYGFLGDVMRFSEKLRCFGPIRYDFSGAVKYVQLKSYHVSIAYKPAPSTTADIQHVCSYKCEACRVAGFEVMGAAANGTIVGSSSSTVTASSSLDCRSASTSGPSSDSEASAQAAGGCSASNGFGNSTAASAREQSTEDWVSLEGEFMSVMAVVTPCRSAKSKKGIIPNGHLSDGRIYLVMVEKCNHFNYIRFLIHLSNKGLTDGCLPFVKVVPVVAAKIKPVGLESSWNVDGELLSNNNVRIYVHRGLVDVFARGVELEVPLMV